MSHAKIQKYCALALIVLLSATFLFINLGEQRLKFGDESIHVLVMQEMRASGNWTEPTFRFEPYFSKPPLKMWLSMALLSLTPDSLYWFRFPDAVLTLSSFIVLFFISLKLNSNPFVPVLAVFFLLLNKVLIFHGARTAVQDSMILFCSTLTIYLFMILRERKEREPAGRQLSLALMIGLVSSIGIMSKYIAGFYGFLVGVPFLFLCDPKNFFKRYKLELALASLIAISPISLWLASVLYSKSSQLIDVLNWEIYQRLFGEGTHSVGENWLYLEALFVKSYWLPAILLWLSTVYVAIKFRKDRATSILLVCWGLLPVVIFSLLQSYLIRYINPSLPAFALAASLMVFEVFGFLLNKAQKKNIAVRFVWLSLTGAWFIWLIILVREPFESQVRRLLTPTPHYKINQLVREIQRYASANPDPTDILFVDTTDSESADFGPGLPDYNRVHLMEVWPMIRFADLGSFDDLTIRVEDDFVIASSCMIERLKKYSVGRKCAAFESGFEKRIQPGKGSYHVLVCLKNCEGLDNFVPCQDLEARFKNNRCEDQPVLKKSNDPMKHVRNPSFTAR